MRPLRLLLSLSLCGLALVGCSSSPASPLSPLPGSWVGDAVSFSLTGVVVSDIAVKGVSCAIESPDPTAPPICSAIPAVPKTASDVLVMTSTPSFLIEAGDLTIQGTFDAAGHAKGVYTFRSTGCCSAPGNCCTASGAWEAWHTTWRDQKGPPKPPSDVGAVSDTGAMVTEVPPVGDSGSLPDSGGASGTASGRAITHANAYRAHYPGLQPLKESPAITQAAQAHADYYATNFSAYQSGKIGAHDESKDFPNGFTGASFGDRLRAAKATEDPSFEVIAFVDDPEGSVDSWIETVYHRIPFFSPDAGSAGYGHHKAPARIDVMDFGAKKAPSEVLVPYPWPDQTGVPRSWDGNEGPRPPAPPKGYPSGPVVSLSVPEGTPLDITAHVLLDPSGKEIAHVWHPRGANGFMSAMWALYAHGPLGSQTRYTTRLTGTLRGKPWSLEWSFTTSK